MLILDFEFQRGETLNVFEKESKDQLLSALLIAWVGSTTRVDEGRNGVSPSRGVGVGFEKPHLRFIF